jgi:hypothetical protein
MVTCEMVKKRRLRLFELPIIFCRGKMLLRTAIIVDCKSVMATILREDNRIADTNLKGRYSSPSSAYVHVLFCFKQFLLRLVRLPAGDHAQSLCRWILPGSRERDKNHLSSIRIAIINTILQQSLLLCFTKTTKCQKRQNSE